MALIMETNLTCFWKLIYFHCIMNYHRFFGGVNCFEKHPVDPPPRCTSLNSYTFMKSKLTKRYDVLSWMSCNNSKPTIFSFSTLLQISCLCPKSRKISSPLFWIRKKERKKEKLKDWSCITDGVLEVQKYDKPRKHTHRQHEAE